MANANWSNPQLTSTYTNFVSEVKNRDEDLALQFDGTTSTNIPTNTIRWDSTANRWKKWNGTSWAELTSTYALTALSTTGAASIGTTLAVTGTITGSSTVTGTALIPSGSSVPVNGVYLPSANSVAIATNSTQRLAIDSSGNITIPGTLAVTGTSTAASFIPTSSTAPTNGVYLPAANSVAISTGGTGRLFVNSNGQIAIGTSSFSSFVNLLAPASTAYGVLDTTTDGYGYLIFRNVGTTCGYFGPGALGTGTNLGISTEGAKALVFGTNNTERIRLDSSGRLGLGTSSPSAKLDIVGSLASTDKVLSITAAGTGGGNAVAGYGHYISCGAANNNTSFTALYSEVNYQIQTSYAAYFKNPGNASNASYGMYAQNTQPDVNGPGIAYAGYFNATAGGTGGLGTTYGLYVNNAATVGGAAYGLYVNSATGAASTVPFSVAVSGSEKVRITSGGFSKYADDGSYIGASASYHEFNSTVNNDVLKVRATNASYTSSCITTSTNLAAGTASYFIYGIANAVNTFQVLNNGNVKNTNNSYTAISDQKLKENITDARSQWADIKALRIVNFKFKQETGLETYKQIGLIAQEVEAISPGLVDETPEFKEVEVQTEVKKTRTVVDEDGNEVTETYTETETSIERQPTGESIKGVKYSILYMKAIKALQEAMQRIEQLEAKVAALEPN